MNPLPCCATAKPRHVRELGHLYQFDFDLFKCSQCERHWVHAWREDMGGWEKVEPEDALTMQTSDETALRPFMRKWAQGFN